MTLDDGHLGRDAQHTRHAEKRRASHDKRVSEFLLAVLRGHLAKRLPLQRRLGDGVAGPAGLVGPGLLHLSWLLDLRERRVLSKLGRHWEVLTLRCCAEYCTLCRSMPQ